MRRSLTTRSGTVSGRFCTTYEYEGAEYDVCDSALNAMLVNELFADTELSEEDKQQLLPAMLFADLPAAIETLEDPMYVSLYEAFLQTRQEYTFYVPPKREDYLSLETRFEKTARLRLAAGRAQYLEQGADALAPLLRTTLAEVQGSYDK